jgi:Zn ribbon nucleic-acid-binding protein
MAKTRCPGQDTAFWKPGDIFEIPCDNCGFLVEFFKDDARRRCLRCGHTMQNYRLNQGCAHWCEHARECLESDPKLVKDKH